MRLLAEERKSGTIEVLMTAPVTDWDIVLSKFFGSLAFYVFLWIPTLIYILILRWYSEIDLGPVFTGYLGTILLGAMFIAIGLFCSSFTRNQVVAAIASFVIITIIWTLGIFRIFVSGTFAQGLIDYLSVFEHFREFSKGIIDTRPLVYYLSSTVLFLFFSARVVESSKWR
jgi:ABC-2 type transport system permease protein